MTYSELERIDTNGIFHSYGTLPNNSVPGGGITTGPDGALWFTAAASHGPSTGWIGRAALQPVPGPFTPSADLPPGYLAASYSTALSASIGTPPYTNWTIQSGALPPGLALDPSSGGITGKPSTLGTFEFRATVQDSSGATSQPWSFSITVVPPACTYSISPSMMFIPPEGGIGTIKISTARGCPWLAGGVPGAFTFTSPTSGTGNGSVTFQLEGNDTGGVLFASFAIGAPAGLRKRPNVHYHSARRNPVPPDYCRRVGRRKRTHHCCAGRVGLNLRYRFFCWPSRLEHVGLHCCRSGQATGQPRGR